MGRNRRSNLPQVRTNYPSTNNFYQPQISKTPFSRNITENRHLHTKGKDETGYDKREVCIKDAKGNMKIARETQVFASWDKISSFNAD